MLGHRRDPRLFHPAFAAASIQTKARTPAVLYMVIASLPTAWWPSMWATAFAASARGYVSEMITRASPDWSSVASEFRFSRLTFQFTSCTFVEPNPMSAARAILGNPAKSPPVLPTLLA